MILPQPPTEVKPLSSLSAHALSWAVPRTHLHCHLHSHLTAGWAAIHLYVLATKTSLQLPHPALPLCLLLFKAMPKGGTSCCRQWLSRALHPSGHWLFCCTGQQQNHNSFPRGCRILSTLARDSGRNGDYLLCNHQNLRAESLLCLLHNGEGKEDRLWLQRLLKEGLSPLFYTCIFLEKGKAAMQGAVHAEMGGVSAAGSAQRVAGSHPASPALVLMALLHHSVNICTSVI